MKKILFIAPLFPFPPKDGWRMRVFNMIKHLSRYYEITVLSFISRDEKRYINDLSLYCEVYTVDKDEGILDIAKNVGMSFFKDKPLLALRDYSKVFENKLKILAKHNFDYVFFESLHSSQYLHCFDERPVKVLDMHNAEHIIWKRMFEKETGKLKKAVLKSQLEKVKSYELSQVKRFDKVFTCSDKDAANLLLRGRENCFVIPNGCTIRDIEFIEKPNIMFVGSLDYLPNEEGISWFLQRVFPRLAKEFPSLMFYVVGKNPSAKIKAFDSKQVKILGFVEDLVPYYNKVSVFVVPLRIGGGTRLKILDAMSFKKCVISTTVGAEGLDIENNKNIMIANEEEDFANKLTGLLKNPQILRGIAEKGYDLVKAKYDWKLIVERIHEILE